MGAIPQTPDMKRIVLMGVTLAAVATLVVGVLMMSFNRGPAPEKVIPVLAEQELLFFYSDFDSFRQAYQRPPASVTEMVMRGRYLEGVVEPNRTLTLRRLEYPLVAPPDLGLHSPAVAAYQVPGFGKFYLL